MLQPVKGKGAKALRLMMVCLLAVSAAATMMVSATTSKAYASDTAYLEIGGSIYYAGYSTNWMYADGSVAYCANPTAATPESDTYSKNAVDAPSGRSAETIADLWFGWGSPGFDPSMFPSSWYDGSAMTDARYVALTHIVVSDTFNSNSDYALYGCNQAFKDWARSYVIGFDENGTMVNAGATGRQMCMRLGEVPDNFYAYQLHTGSGNQLTLSFDYVPNGSLELTKASANEPLSENNDCYSLQGAVYGVYSDYACSDLVASMTTDGEGFAKADEITGGNYYVKETMPSKGMTLDNKVYPVEVRSNETTVVNGGAVYEIPKSDPVGMLAGKVSATNGANCAEGAATLEGAQFTVSYYDGYYTSAASAEASGLPSASWVFETDKDGFCYYSDEFKVAGGALYYQMNGSTACLPLGTAVIYETKAPQGYNLDDGNHDTPKQFCVQITENGAQGESVYTYNSPSVPDTVKRGDYRLMKEVPTTNDEEDQDLTRIAVPGVRFQIINDSEHAIISPDTLSEVQPGDVVTTLVTDENGFATTKDARPSGWTGALAYGEYTVHEVIPTDVSDRVKADYGVTLIAVDDWKITVSAETQYDPVQIVANHIPQTPIVIEKIDSTTDKTIPLACSFQLLDEDGHLVTYTDHYADEVVDTWTTLASGKCMLPMKLDEGTYTLHEVNAPEGYVLGGQDVTFTVDEYRSWDNPITVTYSDAPIRGAIEITKTDTDTAALVAGADYCVKTAADIITGDGTIRANAGDVVANVTTDENGFAKVEGLFLGNYIVYETKSPQGFALDTMEHEVSIESEGQTVPVVTRSVDVRDLPTTIEICKVDSTDATKGLAGVVFRIWQDVADGFETIITTDEQGSADVSYLPHGSYLIEEIEAPQGYFMPKNTEPVAFAVDDQGFIGLTAAGSQYSDTLKITFENTPTILEVAKADLTTGTELPGATLTVVDKDGNMIEEWVSTEEAHRIVGIEPGEYTLTETIAPEGYLFANSIKFTVEETDEVQKVIMYDDYTKVDVSKTDIATGEELEGAHLAIVDEDDGTVAEWITDGKVHRVIGLEPGNYTLREISAPDGYEIAEEAAFTVKATGEIQKVKMEDSATRTPPEGSDLPKTGDDLPWWVFALIGGGLACSAGGLVLSMILGARVTSPDDEKGEKC